MIIYFAISLVSDIVPFMIVIDSKFIKIFSFDLIEKFNRNETDSDDIENLIYGDAL
jgi:hypothetical protein